MHIYNPFQFGTVVRGENFCNREEELSSLKSYIKDGYSVWLYSPRRYGKSSLIQKAFSEVEGIKTISRILNRLLLGLYFSQRLKILFNPPFPNPNIFP